MYAAMHLKTGVSNARTIANSFAEAYAKAVSLGIDLNSCKICSHDI